MTNYELYYDNVQSQLSLVVVRFEIELYVKLCVFLELYSFNSDNDQKSQW